VLSYRARSLSLLALPLILGLAGRSWCARSVGDRVAATLVKWTSLSRIDAGAADLPPAESEAELDPGHGVLAPRLGRPGPLRPHVQRPQEAAEKTDAGSPRVTRVYVPARAVLRVARAKSIRAAPVVDAEGKPLGVALRGVGGTGLHDGDIVTEVSGTRVTTPDGAVAILTHALANNAKTVSGVVLRAGNPVRVTVEVPQEKDM